MHLDDDPGSQPSVVLISSNRFIHGFGFLGLDSRVWIPWLVFMGLDSLDWIPGFGSLGLNQGF